MSERKTAISAYLTRPRRAMKHACAERAERQPWYAPTCDDCPLRQTCAIAVGDLDRGSSDWPKVTSATAAAVPPAVVRRLRATP